jgi:hypothetical protein
MNSKWDERKRSRFQELRKRRDEGALTESESAELALLTQELESAEASYLAQAADRLRSQREKCQAQNRDLEALAARKEALAAKLRNVLAEAQAERRAIVRELAEVMGASQGTDE